MIDQALSSSMLKEIEHHAFQEGYDRGIKDSILTIMSILQHNDIKMKVKEFWIEYENLKQEGVIK